MSNAREQLLLDLMPVEAEPPSTKSRNRGYGASWVRVIFALLIMVLVPLIDITSTAWFVVCGIYLAVGSTSTSAWSWRGSRGGTAPRC
jgi:hypothetical protein